MPINCQSEVDPIKINGIDLNYVSSMKYLGSIKESDGSCTKDVTTRIAMAKKKMVGLNNIWKDRGIPLFLKIKLLKTLIWPVMLYGSESWTLRCEEINKMNSSEKWFYRILLRVK